MNKSKEAKKTTCFLLMLQTNLFWGLNLLIVSKLGSRTGNYTVLTLKKACVNLTFDIQLHSNHFSLWSTLYCLLHSLNFLKVLLRHWLHDKPGDMTHLAAHVNKAQKIPVYGGSQAGKCKDGNCIHQLSKCYLSFNGNSKWLGSATPTQQWHLNFNINEQTFNQWQSPISVNNL